jgi:hypothetical protein
MQEYYLEIFVILFLSTGPVIILTVELTTSWIIAHVAEQSNGLDWYGQNLLPQVNHLKNSKTQLN